MKKIDINKIQENPQNPRYITDSKFKKLVKSIKQFPEMINVRPLVIDENFMVLGGNMRLKALKKAGVTKVPVNQVKDWSEEKKQEFIIKDNVGFGEWDWDILANGWDTQELKDWGLELWQVDDHIEEPDFEELTADDNNKPPTMKITFKNKNDLENAEIYISKILDKYDKAYYSVSAGEL